MMAVLFSIILLLVAPFIYFSGAKTQKLWNKMEKVVGWMVGLWVVLHIFPEIWHSGSFWAFGCLVLGAIFPTIAESFYKNSFEQIHFIAILAAFVGLTIHSLSDGAILAFPDGHMHGEDEHHHLHSGFLSMLVIFHQLPVGVFLFSAFYPKFGKTIAWGFLGFMSFAILVGYLGSSWLLHNWPHAALWSYLEAFLMGSLLHIAFNRHEHHSSHHHHHHRHL